MAGLVDDLKEALGIGKAPDPEPEPVKELTMAEQVTALSAEERAELVALLAPAEREPAEPASILEQVKGMDEAQRAAMVKELLPKGSPFPLQGDRGQGQPGKGASYDRELDDDDVDAYMSLPQEERNRRWKEFSAGLAKTKVNPV